MTDLSETLREEIAAAVRKILQARCEPYSKTEVVLEATNVAPAIADAILSLPALTRAAEVVEKIEGLRGLSDAATAGPWEATHFSSGVTSVAEGLKKNRVHGYGYDDDGFICVLNDGEYHEYSDGAEQEATAAIIAAAVNTIREILTPKAEGGDHG